MPRKARLVDPGMPHHIIQRGNRRMPVFFDEGDYRMYKFLLAEHAAQEGVTFWAYCLMPNHVHLIVVPQGPESLARMFREAHRRYTAYINKREGWTGHLWQDRFQSYTMDEAYCLTAARYIENNPVEAGMVRQAEDYLWSSARTHMGLEPYDGFLSAGPLESLVANWKEFLTLPRDIARESEQALKHLQSGRPLRTARTGTE